MRTRGLGRHAPRGAGCESSASWSLRDRPGAKVELYGDTSREWAKLTSRHGVKGAKCPMGGGAVAAREEMTAGLDDGGMGAGVMEGRKAGGGRESGRWTAGAAGRGRLERRWAGRWAGPRQRQLTSFSEASTLRPRCTRSCCHPGFISYEQMPSRTQCPKRPLLNVSPLPLFSLPHLFRPPRAL